MPEFIIQRPTWAEIDLDNLTFNFQSVRQFINKDIRFMAVVKADAYGHGSIECSKRLEAEGIDWLGVAMPEEGVELRQAGIRVPILCLGSFSAGQELTLLENNLTTVIYQIENAALLDAASLRSGVITNIHVKIDTGMGRIGVRVEDVREFAKELKRFSNVKVEGLMTHFAAADNLKENEFTNGQIRKFYEAVAVFRDKGFDPVYIDLANSPGAVAHPGSLGNMVRLGGILYGLGGDVLPKDIETPHLKPVLSLRTRIAHIKNVRRNETLGYGRTFKSERDSLIATIPIGYKDGYSRSLSNRGRAILNGHFVPVVGRISMDWTLLDVTDLPNAKIGDEVILIGVQNGLQISAEDIAAELGTISYEVTCAIDRRVPKFYNGKA